jgi:tripartite-type tricarboxylate transporter receptor subunit TctC
MNITRRSVLIGAAVAAAPGVSVAQPRYPARPIEMIVAFPAGGGTDIGARSVARFMERHLGEGARIGVINRHGAGGEVGWTSLAQSRADGYTIGFINAPAIVSLTVEKQTRFTIDSFDPIGNLVYDPNVLIVHKDSEFNNLSDMITYARANPGTLTIGTTGAPGNSEHLALLQVQIKANVTFNHAPFGGTAPLKTAILGRHVPVGAMSISETLQDARDGKVKILGLMAEERHRWAPGLATFREQGVDVVAGSWRAIVAPRGVPEPILAQLREALRKAVSDPEYVASSEQSLVPLAYLDAPALDATLRRMHAELTVVWQRSPWR